MIVRKQYVQGLILIEAKNNFNKKVLKLSKLKEIENAVYENLKGVFGDILIDETYYSDKVFELENKDHINEADCVAKLAIDEEEFKNKHEKQSQTNYIFSAVVTETEKALKKPVKSVKIKNKVDL